MYMFGAISTIFRYVVFPYVQLFCDKKSGDPLVKKPLNLTILFASPYLFIMIIGFYCFDSNIGTFAILGSDIYAYLVVPALTIFFGKGKYSVDKWIFSRDLIFSNLALFVYYQLLKNETVEYIWPLLTLLPFLVYLTVQSNDNGWRERMRQLLGLTLDEETFDSEDIYKKRKRREDI